MINTARHKEIINPLHHQEPIHIIGAGATGSRLFTALIELGFTNISIHDFDTVESHNLANQIFVYSDIGEYKVKALQDWAVAKLGEDVIDINYGTFALPHPDVHLEGTVFLLTDTMGSRREIYDQCIEGNHDVTRVIETRMASSYGNVYSFDPVMQGAAWLDTLIDDDKAEASACGSSISVGSTASIIANLAVWQFTLSLVDPESADGITDIFLKPFCMATRGWS